MSRQGYKASQLQCENIIRPASADKAHARFFGWRLKKPYDSEPHPIEVRYCLDERDIRVCCLDWHNQQQNIKHKY